jgi:signal transduction histidine kinase
MATSLLALTQKADTPPRALQGVVQTTEKPSLADAFAAFSSAAKSLERSYFGLGEEVSRLRQELEQERDLRMRREALAEMAALVAHEVRNPLGSLELFAGLLADSALAPQEREWVEQIQSGLRILSATVYNVLEFHGPRPLQLAPTEIHGVLRAVEDLLRPVAQRAGMRLSADHSPESLCILADRHRLEQVFLNLSLNSFRFAAQGGVLSIKTCRDRGLVRVDFEDRGPGIAVEGLGKILDAGLPLQTDIRGLGLAVANRIVEQHGGTIRLTSAPGEGTSFHLRFPLAGTVQ